MGVPVPAFACAAVYILLSAAAVALLFKRRRYLKEPGRAQPLKSNEGIFLFMPKINFQRRC
jgi:hypothetical protein